MQKLYYTFDTEFDDYCWIEITDLDRSFGEGWLAEMCAQNYEDNGNWESSSELDFTLWEKRDDEQPICLGTFTVFREWEPVFSAFKKENNDAN